ncbi:MAG: hypothetical protein Q8K59_05010 [Nitrosomonas sp.]|nr:hypothetical protein [Nitrosomonas sp.]MDP1950447.1 hypothetical protein [Nitrosomonas sp.]
MQEKIFYEQRRIATKRGKQASRKAAARKIGFLEAPLNVLNHACLGGGGFDDFNRQHSNCALTHQLGAGGSLVSNSKFTYLT